MRFRITNNAGILDESVPFLLDELLPLRLTFDGLPKGLYFARLSDKRGHAVTVKVNDENTAEIKAYRLAIGVWYLELDEVKADGEVVRKINCTPFIVSNLAAQTKGLCAYPEINDVLKQLADLTSAVNRLTEWAAEVAPKIHEHKITL